MDLKWLVKSVVAISLVVLSFNHCHAYNYGIEPASATAANGWVETAGEYSSSATGSYSTMNSSYYGDGLFSKITITDAICPTYCQARLQKDIGIYNGNLLRADIRVEKFGSNQTFSYRIREHDQTSLAVVRELARGNFGTSTGQQWTIGVPVYVAAAIEGTEFIFYASNEPQLAKRQFLAPITPLSTPAPWVISVGGDTAGDSISAKVSDIAGIIVSE